jgi:hypothetical protein
MQKGVPAENADAYVHALSGWQRDHVEILREAVRIASDLEEVIKWGHLVYIVNGPVALIRAEKTRVLLGFWRGQRLVSIDPRLTPGGKYEMARIVFREDTTIDPGTVTKLTTKAISLNETYGDPTKISRR